MILLVTGSRDWDNKTIIIHELEMIYRMYHLKKVIHGGAIGADTMAERICRDLGIETEIYYPDWTKYGKGAGIIRNERMLDEGQPNRVLALHKNNSRGTQHMIDYALKHNVDVTIIKAP